MASISAADNVLLKIWISQRNKSKLELETIPHVGENIFENLDTQVLLRCRLVSKAWKEIAEEVLVKRWKENQFLALQNNKV